MKKQMRKIDVLAVAVGSIIGWGCFVMPGNSFLPSACLIGTVIGLFLAAVMAWVIAQSYGYLIRKYPVEGGEFEYTTQAFGKRHAFICGWWLILAYISFIPLNGTAIGLITRYVFPGTITSSPWSSGTSVASMFTSVRLSSLWPSSASSCSSISKPSRWLSSPRPSLL